MRTLSVLVAVVNTAWSITYAMGACDEIAYMCPQLAEEYQSESIKAYFTPDSLMPYQPLFCAHTHTSSHDCIEQNSLEHLEYTMPCSMELFYVLKARTILQDVPALKLVPCRYKDKYMCAYTQGDVIAIYNYRPVWKEEALFSVWNIRTCEKRELDLHASHKVWLKLAVEHEFQSPPDLHFCEDSSRREIAAYAIYSILRKRRCFESLTQEHIDHLMIIAGKKKKCSKKGIR